MNISLEIEIVGLNIDRKKHEIELDKLARDDFEVLLYQGASPTRVLFQFKLKQPLKDLVNATEV